ncbi:hypothetical protein Q1695_002617 [Nippostrongylus brasiliensis]|nr:hypothetical protein Q1695_002617 [Nippostrongylus brasiliensis]
MASSTGKLLRNAAALVNVAGSRSYALPADPLARFKAIAAASGERPRVLITGALGQLGRGLNSVYKYMYGDNCVVMTDIVKAPRNATDVSNYSYLDIMSQQCIERLVVNEHIDTIVHFSALLSAIGEQNVNLALQINCRGVENILEVAKKHHLKVFIPSTIGAFGPTTPRDDVPDLTIQMPTTIYGVSKVYAERLGEYYNHKFGVDFRSLRFPGIISATKPKISDISDDLSKTFVYAERLGEYYNHKFGVDFRSLRFPGIISATKPGGGTTDYAIQIFYDALEKGRHTCYLRPDTKLPMMYDTDCMASVVQFLATPAESLSHRVYNVTGFSFTPEEIANAIKKVMPHFEIEYKICDVRQAIADSWPRSLDDSQAKKDWGWRVEYGLEETVEVMFALLQRDVEANSAANANAKAARDAMEALNNV